MICEPGDVAVVPFPFSERPGAKRRPALVLSAKRFNRHGHSSLAMITSKAEPSWPGDVSIENLAAAGLPRPCIVRLKLFTLDNRLILSRAGRLGRKDRDAVEASLSANLA